tara:strand:+ start:46 stop:825 length:780 start_codon:yes stop_codon:yes gene_type:complete
MSSYEVIKGFLKSEDFKKLYSDYLKKRDNHLVEFLDNIDLNKKYYRMNINKNKRYKKEITEDTSSIKEINSMINKITDKNYLILKKSIIEKITVDHIVPYIIQKIVESSMVHHIYIPFYVGILKEINSSKKKAILLKLCNKYHTQFFYENKIMDKESSYEILCSENKKIDNIIGFSLFISHLEKEDIIDNFIDKVLDPFMKNLTTLNDVELYKMLVSFESIANIHYNIIPQRYKVILTEIKGSTKTSKIKFKIMDILGE